MKLCNMSVTILQSVLHFTHHDKKIPGNDDLVDSTAIVTKAEIPISF
jgi:hypothetical protein